MRMRAISHSTFLDLVTFLSTTDMLEDHLSALSPSVQLLAAYLETADVGNNTKLAKALHVLEPQNRAAVAVAPLDVKATIEAIMVDLRVTERLRELQ
jgi:hypothetical protein